MLLYNSYKFHLSAPILLYFGALHPTCLRRNFSYSRWWDQRVVIRRVSRTRVVADRSSRHPHHQALRKSWPPRLSCFANLSKGSSEVDTTPINLKLLVIRISLQPSLLCSTGQKNYWTRMLEFAQSSPSLHYFWCHVRRKIKFDLPCNSFAVLRVFGGTTTMACFRPITLSLGMNSRMHLGVTIFQRVLWKGN